MERKNNNTVEEIIRKRRNEYAREWRKRNPDKVAAAQARFYLKKVAEHKAATQGNEDSAALEG